jgi:hypothetical protein
MPESDAHGYILAVLGPAALRGVPQGADIAGWWGRL